MITIKSLFFTFVIAGLITTILTPVVIFFAHKIGGVEQGGYRKINVKPIPLMGGIAVAVPFLIICFLGFSSYFYKYLSGVSFIDLKVLIIGCVSILGVGIVDDIFYVRARVKLLSQLLIASLILLTGHVLSNIYIPFFGNVVLNYWLGSVISIAWIVGLINAFNLIDGVDGLASGIACIASIALAVLCGITGNVFVMILFGVLAASLIGFLVFNFYPAKIFLGDTGSMFLGYVIAMLTLMGSYKSELAIIVLVPLLTLGLPIFETVVSIMRRYVRGAPIFAADSHHTHHRLLNKGYSQVQVVLILYTVSILLAVSAIMNRLLPNEWQWTSIVLFALTLGWIAWIAGYLRPKSFNLAIRRRQHNNLLKLFTKYAICSFNAHPFGCDVHELLLRLCQHELGVKFLQVTKQGNKVFLIGEQDIAGKELYPIDSFNIEAASGKRVDVLYQFNYSPNDLERRDVSVCLANIFSSIRV